MKNVKRVFIAITLIASSAFMTACMDNSEEVFKGADSGANSATVNESNEDQWD